MSKVKITTTEGEITAVAIGTWIGAKVFQRLPTDTVKKISYGYIALSGVTSLIM